MVLRMARRNCHRYSVAGGQQSAVRNACRGSASGHTDEISSAGRGGIVRRASLATVAAVVLAYQSIGTLGEWAICGSFIEATCDFRIGLPGMLLQTVGGWLAIHRLGR